MAKSTANTTEPVVDQQESDNPVYKMVNQLAKFRANYKPYQRPSGSISLDNADNIATLLRPLEPMRVKRIAETLLDVDLSRYNDLNNGQIRMNSGNRLRGAFKRGEFTLKELKSTINAVS